MKYFALLFSDVLHNFNRNASARSLRGTSEAEVYAVTVVWICVLRVFCVHLFLFFFIYTSVHSPSRPVEREQQQQQCRWWWRRCTLQFSALKHRTCLQRMMKTQSNSNLCKKCRYTLTERADGSNGDSEKKCGWRMLQIKREQFENAKKRYNYSAFVLNTIN